MAKKKTNIKQQTQALKTPKIPKNINDSIPYLNVYENGIIEVAPFKFSKSYILPDANFKVVSNADQEVMTEQYTDFLNSFNDNIEVEVTLYNKTINLEDFKDNVLIKEQNNELDEYRKEYNQMVLDKLTRVKKNIKTEKILTLTATVADIEEANRLFSQLGESVSDGLVHITKEQIKPMTLEERLEMLNTIYNNGKRIPLNSKRSINGKEIEYFTLENCAKQGISTKDVIAPESIEVKSKYIKIGDRYVSTMYVSNYPTWIKGTILTDFTNIGTNVLISAYFQPIEQSEAIKLIRRQGVNISSKIIDRQKKSNGEFDPSLLSPKDQSAKEEADEMLDQMTKENVKLYTTNFIITVFADSEEDLRIHTDHITTIANKHLLGIQPMIFQEEIGFNSALPLGNNQMLSDRLMTSLSVSAITPFSMKEMMQENGMYYGLNAVTKNPIIYNRTKEMNPNGCILGMPGAGKSFAAKREMINTLLGTEDVVFAIDPEREYMPMAKALNGDIVKIAKGTTNYINPFDINLSNTADDGDPVKVKSDFISSLCDIMLGGKYGLTPQEQSIIDRTVEKIYQEHIIYLRNHNLEQDEKTAPTMKDFYNELNRQPELEAKNLALSLEKYVNGSDDLFSHHTNIDIKNRFVVYDIKDIGEGLMELGLHICLDHIWNTMIQNHHKGVKTWFYVDEFHVIMKNESSANYIASIWKRARKWNGIPCAITQNVEDMLKNENARTVINNCVYKLILSQSPLNRAQLSDILGLSKEEQRYIAGSKPGMGLIQIDTDTIPVDDNFPTDTKLYKIMTTKPEERL